MGSWRKTNRDRALRTFLGVQSAWEECEGREGRTVEDDDDEQGGELVWAREGKRQADDDLGHPSDCTDKWSTERHTE
jgi:hypothetical protein